MKMGPGDYQIYGVGSGHLWVVAGIPTMGWDWPLQIIHRGKTYKFSNNEAMDDWIYELRDIREAKLYRRALPIFRAMLA